MRATAVEGCRNWRTDGGSDGSVPSWRHALDELDEFEEANGVLDIAIGILDSLRPSDTSTEKAFDLLLGLVGKVESATFVVKLGLDLASSSES